MNYCDPEICRNSDDRDCECMICTDKLHDEVLNYDVAKLECGHYFHRPCILEWFNRVKKCPKCRSVPNSLTFCSNVGKIYDSNEINNLIMVDHPHYNPEEEINEYDFVEDDDEEGFVDVLELIREEIKRKKRRMLNINIPPPSKKYRPSYDYGSNNSYFGGKRRTHKRRKNRTKRNKKNKRRSKSKCRKCGRIF